MTVQDELVTLGGRLIASFSQSEFNTTTSDRGYCAGIVLDWTRRVLLGRIRDGGRYRDDYLGYTRYNDETHSRYLATDKRMHMAWADSAKSYVNQTVLQSVQMDMKNLLDNSKDVPGGVPIKKALAERLFLFVNLNGFNLQQDPSGKMSHARMEHVIGLLSQSEDQQLVSDTLTGRRWEEVAETLDQSAQQIRLRENRAVSARRFANIVVVKSNPPIPYADPHFWLKALLSEWIPEGCCTVLAFQHPKSPGHQIAVKRTGDEYLFFDPNYGVFCFTLVQLGNCFAHLFLKRKVHVTDQTTLDPDLPVYCRRDVATGSSLTPWKEVGYTVFKKA